MADAREFNDQAVTPEDLGNLGDDEAIMFPEIGVALVHGAALESHGLSAQDEISAEGPVEPIEPEYFAFADKREHLRGFLRAAATIAKDLGAEGGMDDEEDDVDAEVLGATWGLIRCKVPPRSRSGLGIGVAVLDTGMDLRHPDFAGRSITSRTFVGQPVQDLNSHGTHDTGTACGPKAPPGATPRYGIAFGSRIFAGEGAAERRPRLDGGRAGWDELGHRQSLSGYQHVARRPDPGPGRVHGGRPRGTGPGLPDYRGRREPSVEHRGASQLTDDHGCRLP